MLRGNYSINKLQKWGDNNETGIAVAAEDHTEITGVIAQTDNGFVIQTQNGEVAAVGADLETMVGKTVKATGQVIEGDAGKVFNVMAIQEVQEDVKE